MYKKFNLFVLVMTLFFAPSYGLADNQLDAKENAAIEQSLNTNDANDDTARDPLEKFNRAMFSFNETLDKYFLKPVASLYDKIVPHPLAKGIRNVYNNLSGISSTGNDLLQANFYQATSDFWRLLVNTTVGVGGFFDVATTIGLPENDEDFGLTLAKWGYSDSTYIVLPFFGPSTIRDAIGKPVDYYAFSIYPYIDNRDVMYGIYGLGVVSQRAELLHYDPLVSQIAIDKYVFVRNVYLQKRAAEIQRGKELSDPYAKHYYTSKIKGQNTTNPSSGNIDDEYAKEYYQNQPSSQSTPPSPTVDDEYAREYYKNKQ